jgi:phospholipid N-methyltransferase
MAKKKVVIDGLEFAISDEAKSLVIWCATPRRVGQIIPTKKYNLKGELIEESEVVVEQSDLDVIELGHNIFKGGHCQHGLRKDNSEWITI